MSHRSLYVSLGLCLVLITPISLGCGGGGGGSIPTPTPSPSPSPSPSPTPSPSPSPTPLPTTRASFTIQWPARGRALVSSAAALSAKITVAAAPSLALIVNRETAPAGYSQTYQSAESIAAGSYLVTVQFYSDANATGSLVAEASATATLASDGSGLDTLTLVGKIASLELTAPSTLVVGDTSATLMATARSASGQIIAITPGSFRYQVQTGDAVQLTSDAKLSAVKQGNADVVALLDSLTSPTRRVVVQDKGGVDLTIR
jgi:hypothetical protein